MVQEVRQVQQPVTVSQVRQVQQPVTVSQVNRVQAAPAPVQAVSHDNYEEYNRPVYQRNYQNNRVETRT